MGMTVQGLCCRPWTSGTEAETRLLAAQHSTSGCIHWCCLALVMYLSSHCILFDKYKGRVAAFEWGKTFFELSAVVSLEPRVEEVKVIRECCLVIALVGGAAFTAAIFLRSCQAEQRLPLSEDCFTMSWYFSFFVFVCSLIILSMVHCLIVFTTICALLAAGLYADTRKVEWWSAEPSGGRATDLYASDSEPQHLSRVFSRWVVYVRYWWTPMTTEQ